MFKCINLSIYLYEGYVLGVQGYHLNSPSLSQLNLDASVPKHVQYTLSCCTQASVKNTGSSLVSLLAVCGIVVFPPNYV